MAIFSKQCASLIPTWYRKHNKAMVYFPEVEKWL